MQHFKIELFVCFQVLDPFDELLKDDGGSKANNTSKRRTRSAANDLDTESNMDDDTNADDDVNDSSHIDEDHTEVPGESIKSIYFS